MEMYKPAHPGETLKEICLKATGLTVAEAAEALGVDRKELSDLLNKRSRLDPDMAMRIAAVFGGTPEVWLRVQLGYDEWQIRHSRKKYNLKKFVTA